MANTINYASVFQQELDKAFVHEACTSWMDENAGLVKYEGGREIKIPVMALDGLADYSRSTGYVEGDVSLTYETKTMTQDRGRGFTLDAMTRATSPPRQARSWANSSGRRWCPRWTPTGCPGCTP